MPNTALNSGLSTGQNTEIDTRLSSEMLSDLVKDLASYHPRASFTSSEIEKFQLFMEQLHTENEKFNLTAIRDVNESLVLNLYDSLTYLKGVSQIREELPESYKLCDMGSGNGCPAIPLTIVENVQTTCIESIAKKAQFIQATSEQLNLPIKVVNQRIEEYSASSDIQGSYDMVTARALDSLPVLLEYASPLLKIGGYAVFSKGNISEDELGRGELVAQKTGFRRIQMLDFDLVKKSARRMLIIYKKEAKASVRLPRAIGKAHKRPLA